MEYIDKNGTIIRVNGDLVQYGDDKIKKNKIGANYVHGVIVGGYLSSFNGTFNEESIGIESGIGDIVSTRMGDIKEAYKLLKTKIKNIDNTNIYAISSAVLETVDEYFKGFSNIDSRMKYYSPDDFDESKNNKISNLKGTGAAMCVERAALTQNLLTSLGINSFFKTSGIIKDNNKEVHSYNLIEYNGKYYIFDTSIPNIIDEKINPLIAEIDKETFELLSCPIRDFGISITVSHYNPYRNSNVTITYDSNRPKQKEVEPISTPKAKHRQ